jgi:rRNA maturation protein Nop10
MSMGSVHCPQCRLYVTSEGAEVCPRCGYSLADARSQGPDRFAYMTDAPPRWPSTTWYETPLAPDEAFWPDPGDQGDSWSPPSPRRRDDGSKLMLKGCLWSLAGLALTGGSYALASPGGIYFIFWGLMLYGGILFLRGMFKGM